MMMVNLQKNVNKNDEKQKKKYRWRAHEQMIQIADFYQRFDNLRGLKNYWVRAETHKRGLKT